MASLFDDRVRSFDAWMTCDLAGEIGRGNYSKVFLTTDCSAAAKVAAYPRASLSTRKQAFREHVVSLLQTLLVLRRVTPFHPLHYGSAFDASGTPSLTMYMESFEGSLEVLGAQVLASPVDWAKIAFQVCHGTLALSLLFEVTHNDLYPRNILVRRLPEATRVSLAVEGVAYDLELASLAVVTDYGIASGPCLGCELPEVSSGLNRLQTMPAWFAPTPLKEHVLVYAQLPAYARDPFVILKGLLYAPGSELPVPPLSVKLWGLDALRRMVAALGDFSEPRAQLRLFHHLFHEDNLRAFKLEALTAPRVVAGGGGGSTSPQYHCELTLRAKKALRIEGARLLARLGEGWEGGGPTHPTRLRCR